MAGVKTGISGQINNNIVTDELIFYIDPQYKISYPGTGTTITDLRVGVSTIAINNATVTKIHPDNFDSSATVIDFDGSGDTLSFSSPSLSSPFTVSLWHKARISAGTSSDPYAYGYLFSSTSGKGMALSEGGTSGGVDPGEYYYWNGSSPTPISTVVAQNEVWGNVSVVFNTSGNEIKFYFNGVLNQTTTVSSIGNTFNQLGRYSTSNWYLNGQIGPCCMYNKELSAGEVLQNYQAQKGRFGL